MSKSNLSWWKSSKIDDQLDPASQPGSPTTYHLPPTNLPAYLPTYIFQALPSYRGGNPATHFLKLPPATQVLSNRSIPILITNSHIRNFHRTFLRINAIKSAPHTFTLKNRISLNIQNIFLDKNDHPGCDWLTRIFLNMKEKQN